MEKRVCKAKFSTSRLPSPSPHQAGLHIASVLRARSPQKLQRAWLCKYVALEWPKSACCCDPKVIVYAQSFRGKAENGHTVHEVQVIEGYSWYSASCLLFIVSWKG